MSLLQNMVSFIGLFGKRDLYFSLAIRTVDISWDIVYWQVMRATSKGEWEVLCTCIFYTCKHIRISIFNVHICTYTYLFMCIYIYICIYINVYIAIHTHTYVFTYTYT